MARIDRNPQADLFGAPPTPEKRLQRTPTLTLIDPDPSELTVGNSSLKRHLEAMGIRDPFIVRDTLAELDYTEFLRQYQGGGRAPYAPRCMVGILLYGLMRGVTSLRALERFSRTDLGCWWVSGGITPDHSILGRFMQKHETVLKETLFSAVVTAALRQTETSASDLAGDGTVIEAMSSRYGLLRAEALKQAREALAEAEDEASVTQRTRLQALEEALWQRRKESGHPKSYDRGHPMEPDASVLKQKGGGHRLSYAPVVLANSARVVVDAEVAPGYELKAMVKALRGTEAKRVSLDNGFLKGPVLETAVERELDALIATKGEAGGAEDPEGGVQQYRVEDFKHREGDDVYVCPAGQVLVPIAESKGGIEGGGYVRYANRDACGACAQRGKCTKSRYRIVQRSRATMLRETMRQIMKHPQARARYARHKAWVEPVFSELRLRQGLNRFRRRGLEKVRLEFRLHLTAYNLSRIVAWVLRELSALKPSDSSLRALLSALQGLLGRPIPRSAPIRAFMPVAA
jgi:transposase